MKPVDFDLHQPGTVAEAVGLLASAGDEAKVLAGGQSLVPLLNFRLARPAHVVDIGRIRGLDGIRADDGQIVLGAMVRQADAEDLLRGRPLEAARLGRAAATATAGLAPPDDLHGSGEYRRHLAAVLIRRAVSQAHERARGGSARPLGPYQAPGRLAFARPGRRQRHPAHGNPWGHLKICCQPLNLNPGLYVLLSRIPVSAQPQGF